MQFPIAQEKNYSVWYKTKNGEWFMGFCGTGVTASAYLDGLKLTRLEAKILEPKKTCK